ncbi:hypothetical protein GCM10028820_18590 [Tessaracoccus terricola]
MTGAQWTASLRDPDLPAVAALLTDDTPGPLAAIAQATGGTLVAHKLTNVTWWPGKSCTVQWTAEIDGGQLQGVGDFVATTLEGPKGSLRVGDGTDDVTVWRIPHDPFLPALAQVLAPGAAAKLVAELDGELDSPSTRLRAYRPSRRAVIEVQGEGNRRVYFKLVKPKRLESLRRRHDELSQHLPVPEPLGVNRELGLLVMPTMRGLTLREVLEDPNAALPDPEVVVGLPEQLPELSKMGEVTSSITAAARMAELLTELLPAQAERIAALLERIGTDEVTERVVAHGDYHEAQLLVEDGAIVSILDVDTVGWGRPGDDAAVMLAHLTLWSAMSSQPDRVRSYAVELQQLWDDRLDPVDLRRRVAARLMGLAVGPFRAQVPDWPVQVSWRLDLVESWLDAAEWCTD